MLLSPLCPLLFQPLLAAAQKYSQTLELGKLGIYLQGFAMERKREEEETRGCFSRNPVLRMQDFFPADLQADSLKESEENNGLCKKNDRKTAQPLCSSAHRLPALHRNVREKWWHTHTCKHRHAYTSCRSRRAMTGHGGGFTPMGNCRLRWRLRVESFWTVKSSRPLASHPLLHIYPSTV